MNQPGCPVCPAASSGYVKMIPLRFVEPRVRTTTTYRYLGGATIKTIRKRVGVVGLFSNENIGDYLLVESAKFLLKKHSPDISLQDVDVDPRDPLIFQGRRRINLYLHVLLLRNRKMVFSIIRLRTFQYFYEYFMWWLKVNWYYKEVMQSLDGLVIAGGGFIKFKTQGLNYLDEQIIKIAEKRNIPVMFNAVGVEGYDPNDIRSRRLKRALNSDVVRVITTRDDLTTLRNSYITNKSIISDLVGDPVFWLQDAFSIEKRSDAVNVGINLINPDNYKEYGGEADSFKIANFYKNLIQELNIQGVDFYLFSNGMEVDQRFGEQLVAAMNLPQNRLIRRPESSVEFLATMTDFKVILAARMHAGIVAYALDIPKVGLIWSEKIDFLAHLLGERDAYFNEEELDYRTIVQLLIKSESLKIDTTTRDTLKQKTFSHIGSFLDDLDGTGGEER
ncbi:polysaccharide pyruvyl transferase family protein [Salinibacterium sp. NG253]|uniref:polysaccharide pyruvyl transferase family protein n=1 Tax=Salinibacterium sp. NG253 TaxID=2792039 RepID=UPI0018CDE7D6|nr:polysaccharide pyruvyl transferase family protein [Salinibacterium sp. NG253]MBH0116139.1 polysaccharide pyruvyl transferase family protein [Salinibacterium sp. NG253]